LLVAGGLAGYRLSPIPSYVIALAEALLRISVKMGGFINPTNIKLSGV